MNSKHNTIASLITGNVLIEDSMDDILSQSENETAEEFEKKLNAIQADKERAKAVQVLIDDKLIDEAVTLLNIIDSHNVKGKKELLYAYIYATQGRCDKANLMFDRAIEINPDICIQGEYKNKCE